MEEVFSRAIDKQTGLGGFVAISGTSAVTGAFWAMVVNSDAVITQVLDKNGTNITSLLGLTGVTIKAGMFLPMPKHDYFSSITLASGSVVAYRS
jgi:hypothetical protein